MQAPTRLFHYQAEALLQLIEQAGFEDARLRCPWYPGELSLSLILLGGFRGVLPALVLPPKGPARVAIRALLYATLPLDLLVTLLLARRGRGGVLSIVARRSAS